MRFSKKAEDKVKRFKEVEALLQDPGVSQDQAKMKDLGKEFRALQKVTGLYAQYLKIQEEVAEVEHILKDKNQPADLVSMATHEMETLEKRKKKTVHELEGLLIQEDPMLSKNAILEIRAGTGGLEAGLFAGDLFRMYSRFASVSGFKMEVLSSSPNEAGGFKEIVASVTGQGAY